jgi:hypothetical protein
MLFDLRGSGRRRTVKIVYITLAFLMGGGLILFGIGGGGALPGGLVDAIQQGGSGDSGTDRFVQQEEQASAKARANPTAANWAAVARARFNVANTGDNVDPSTGNYTDAGAEQLRAAGRAWDESVKLAGKKAPDSRVASLMVQAYAGLGQLEQATAAQEIVARDRNSAGAYATLATLAYQANNLRLGDLAKGKALDLTEPDMRESLRGQLESARAQAAQSSGQATPTPTPTPAEK